MPKPRGHERSRCNARSREPSANRARCQAQQVHADAQAMGGCMTGLSPIMSSKRSTCALARVGDYTVSESMKGQMTARMFGISKEDHPTFLALSKGSWRFEDVCEAIETGYPDGPPKHPGRHAGIGTGFMDPGGAGVHTCLIRGVHMPY